MDLKSSTKRLDQDCACHTSQWTSAGAHLCASASSRARLKRMCTNHGPYLRPSQVWTTSRKRFRSLESAHSSRQRAKDAAAHNALNTHAHRDNRMDWGDWRSEEINATRCVMSAPFDGRPSTRRNTRPKRTMSCQAIDRLAEWEAN